MLFVVCVGISYNNLRHSLARHINSEYTRNRIDKGARVFDEMHAEHMEVETQDGLRIATLVIPVEHPQRVIIMCHGFHATKELMADCVHALHDKSTTFVLFDFRAHGESEGKYASLGHHETKDLEAVIDMVKHNAHMKNLPLYGIGISMGGAILLSVARQGNVFAGLVIESTFTDLKGQLQRSYSYKAGLPLFPFSYIARYLFQLTYLVSLESLSPVYFIHEIKTPILFIHAENDKITPLLDIEMLYEQAQEPKYIWIIPSSKHGQMCHSHPQEYSKELHKFFKLAGA